MVFLDILIGIIYGVVEGITEWLPVSSTAHMVFLNLFLDFSTVSENFFALFQIAIQLGAVMAIVVLYFKTIWPFEMPDGQFKIKVNSLRLWMKILISCVPAVIVGLLFDDAVEAVFYHPIPIAIALIAVGALFLWVEKRIAGYVPKTRSISQITYKEAFFIGLFQIIAIIFPGTSRSGITIIGSLLLGISRPVATGYTFFLAVPVMFGASLLEYINYPVTVSASEVVILIVASLVAFFVSLFIIRIFVRYIKRYTFVGIGYYRIIFGIIMLLTSIALGAY